MAVSKGPGKVRQESAPSANLAAPLKARLFNYDIDDATLKKEHREWLEKNIIPLLLRSKKTIVELRGTASRSGSDSYNLKLSERRAKGIDDFLAQSGVARDQILFRGLGERPAALAGRVDGSENETDRAVLMDINPPSKVFLARFERTIPTQDEDGFDPLATPRFLVVSAWFGATKTLNLVHGESLKLRSTKPEAVKFVDPNTNLLVDELIVSGDPAKVTFVGREEGIAFIEAVGVNGAKRRLLEVHSVLHKEIPINIFWIKDSKGRMPVNRSKTFVDALIKDVSRIWKDQANVSFKVDKFEQMDVNRDLGVEITNKETSAGKNFHILSDKVANPKRINIFLVWEWNPDDGNADAEVNKIGGKFIIFEDDLVKGSTPGRVLGHEIGHLLTLTHDDVNKDVLMFGGVGLTSGRLRKDEILKARKGI